MVSRKFPVSSEAEIMELMGFWCSFKLKYPDLKPTNVLAGLQDRVSNLLLHFRVITGAK